MAELPLVFVEVVGGEATEGSLGLLGRARQVFGRAAAVVCGAGTAALAEDLGVYGADKVFLCDDERLGLDLGPALTDVLTWLIERHGLRTVLFETSSLTADIAAALAVRVGGGVNWGLHDLLLDGDDLVGLSTAAEGRLHVAASWAPGPRLALLVPGAVEPRRFPNATEVHRFTPEFRDGRRTARLLETTTAHEVATRTLGNADVIVAGGRGLNDASALLALEELATLLNGAVGVSMPIVDRGWYPYEHQVGSATPAVRPRIYIACGISGSLQHRIGMRQSRYVVAINTDRDAPIMNYCDVAVAGDLHEVVPRLSEFAKRNRGSVGVHTARADPRMV